MSAAVAWLSTARAPGGAAIASIEVRAAAPDALDGVLGAVGIPVLRTGQVRLADIAGVDTGLVARWEASSAQLMPHGGALIIDTILHALAASGAEVGAPEAPGGRYPEARDHAEACAMDAIARASSTRAIDVILRHAELVRRGGRASASPELDRLLTPPLVVLVGAPNIGKSSLTNALAQRAVSIVADEPGTTRDHVGVTLDLDGLVVRWVDGAGLASDSRDAIDARSGDAVRALADRADLIVSARDAQTPAIAMESGAPVLRVGLRADLRESEGVDVQTSARERAGLTHLAREVRERLVPDSALASETPWRFHEAL